MELGHKGWPNSAVVHINKLEFRLAAAERVVEAAQVALDKWSAMPDAGLGWGPDNPRYEWWYETAHDRDFLREALAALDAAHIGESIDE